MSLDERSYPTQGTTGVRLCTCPLLLEGGPERCDYEFTDHESRYKHYLDHHLPEDAGLSPLRTNLSNDAAPERHSAPVGGV